MDSCHLVEKSLGEGGDGTGRRKKTLKEKISG